MSSFLHEEYFPKAAFEPVHLCGREAFMFTSSLKVVGCISGTKYEAWCGFHSVAKHTSISPRRPRVNINIAWFQSGQHQDRQEARHQSRLKLSSKNLVKDQPKGVAKYDVKPVPKIILSKDKKVAHLMLRKARLLLTVRRELDGGLTLCYKMLVSGGDRVSPIYKPTRQCSHVDQATKLLVSNFQPIKAQPQNNSNVTEYCFNEAFFKLPNAQQVHESEFRL